MLLLLPGDASELEDSVSMIELSSMAATPDSNRASAWRANFEPRFFARCFL